MTSASARPWRSLGVVAMVMADAHGVTKLAPAAATTRENSAIAKVGESAVKTLPMVNSDRPKVQGLCHASKLAVKDAEYRQRRRRTLY